MKPLRPSSPLLAVAMIRDPGFLSWDDFDNSCLKAARDTQPYRVGDVIRWLDLDRHGQRVLRAGLVVYVRPEYLERVGDWCPVFLVRPQRKDGEFAAGYLRVWPGEVERGEALAAELDAVV